MSSSVQMVCQLLPELKADVDGEFQGLHSVVRGAVLGRQVTPQETGDLAYRATIPRARVEELKNPTLDGMLKRQEVRLWWGNSCHAVLYPVRHSSVFNLVLS